MQRSIVSAAVVVALMVGLTGGTAPAGALNSSTTPSAVSFTGAYRLHESFGGGQWGAARIVIHADGTVTDNFGQGAHWTSVGKTIVIASSIADFADTFVGKRTATGIATRQNPGVLIQYVGGVEHTGIWYAVKKS